MWTLSLPCMFWSTVAIQLISVATIVAMQLFPSGRKRNACEQVFIGLMLAIGLRDRPGTRVGQRCVDDVWGDFVGYDDVRHVRFRRSRANGGLISEPPATRLRAAPGRSLVSVGKIK